MFLLAGVPIAIIAFFSCLWHMLDELMDTPRCLLWGVPPAWTPQERETADRILAGALPQLNRLTEQLEKVRRARLRKLGMGEGHE
jgi:hypothetical protein